MADLGGRVAAAKEAYEAAAAQLERRRARLRECDREISGVVKERDDLAKQLTDAQVERKRLEHKCVLRAPLRVCWVVRVSAGCQLTDCRATRRESSPP